MPRRKIRALTGRWRLAKINQQPFQLLNGLMWCTTQGEYAYADEIVLAALEKLRKGPARI